jgi:nucleoside 2-deoxyribosyltransferase
MMENNCPICGNPLEPADDPGIKKGDYEYVNCAHSCGQYKISRSLLRSFPELLQEDKNRVFLLSHFLRKMQGGIEIPSLESYLAEKIFQTTLPSLPDQSKHLILWIGKHTRPGENAEESIEVFQAIMGAESIQGTRFIIDHLVDGGYLSAEMFGGGASVLRLSMKGWEYYDQLNRGAIVSRKAFMAMQYGDEELDAVFENYFKPAVKATGFDLVRLDEKPQAGLIDDRLRVEIRTSRFLIADLTHENRGAYWEAGFAEGLGKPVIYTCEKSKFGNQKTHFDTNHHETVVWESGELEEATQRLKNTIRATLPDEAVMTDVAE